MTRDKWTITWGEFKEKVESQGVADDAKIAWIDCNGYNDPEVKVDNYSSDEIGKNIQKMITISEGEDRREYD